MGTGSRKNGGLTVLTAVLCSATAVALMVAPRQVGNPVRTVVCDAAGPGLFYARLGFNRARHLVTPLMPSPSPSEALARLKDRLSRSKQQSRRLQIRNARLRDKLKEAERQARWVHGTRRSQPLVIPALLEATVLGSQQTLEQTLSLLIDGGYSDEHTKSALVLETSGPVIDQGRETRLSRNDPVYSGRIVIGKIAQVGRWTSTVQLVTHEKYRGKAQLARPSSEGFIWGARGILAGQGQELCRLKFVGSRQAVSVGDWVYTARETGSRPARMYYGRVVKAKVHSGAPEWTIWVKPAFLAEDIETVQILRRKLNPVRLGDSGSGQQ